jgi:hypothetical protein
MNLDQELRRALARKSPPPGFDDRVLRRLASGERGMVPVARRRWQRVVLPIAASVLLAFGWHYHARQQQLADAERAAREVTYALQITGEKLTGLQIKVREMNQHEDHTQP